MANAKVCDRCGKYYTSKNKTYSYKGHSLDTVVLYGAGIVSETKLATYDLCDECAKKLVKFLNEVEE